MNPQGNSKGNGPKKRCFLTIFQSCSKYHEQCLGYVKLFSGPDNGNYTPPKCYYMPCTLFQALRRTLKIVKNKILLYFPYYSIVREIYQNRVFYDFQSCTKCLKQCTRHVKIHWGRIITIIRSRKQFHISQTLFMILRTTLKNRQKTPFFRVFPSLFPLGSKYTHFGAFSRVEIFSEKPRGRQKGPHHQTNIENVFTDIELT